ncbi:MAG: hypothetical protein ACJAYJ_004936, partial [Saprospiraceae bacterium]
SKNTVRVAYAYGNACVPQTPFEKQITYYQKYFLSGRVTLDTYAT